MSKDNSNPEVDAPVEEETTVEKVAVKKPVKGLNKSFKGTNPKTQRFDH